MIPLTPNTEYLYVSLTLSVFNFHFTSLRLSSTLLKLKAFFNRQSKFILKPCKALCFFFNAFLNKSIVKNTFYSLNIFYEAVIQENVKENLVFFKCKKLNLLKVKANNLQRNVIMIMTFKKYEEICIKT